MVGLGLVLHKFVCQIVVSICKYLYKNVFTNIIISVGFILNKGMFHRLVNTVCVYQTGKKLC